MKFPYLLQGLLYLHVPYQSLAFSTAPQGHHFDVHQDHLDNHIDDFFFTDKRPSIDGESQEQERRRRQRLGVEYVPVLTTPARPRPPLHPPNWRVLESAQVPFPTMEPISEKSWTGSSMDPFVILVSAAGGLWTVTPIVYWHCMDQNMLNLFPNMIIAGAIEVTTMLLILLHGNNPKLAVTLYAALRVGAVYLMSVPLNVSLEVVEGLVLFASSLLLVEALSVHHHDNTKHFQSS